MTNERNGPDRDQIGDERVTRVYDKLSTERAPEHLDRMILRQAEKAARPAYSRSILWTRPLAWAAVVAICLAITLQVTQLPVPEDVSGIASIASMDTDARSDRPNAVADNAGRIGEPGVPARQNAGTAKAPSSGDAKLAEDIDDERRLQREAAVAADSPATPPAEAARVQSDIVQEERAVPLPEPIEMQDADMLRRAEDMVRQRAGTNKETEHPALGVSGFAPATASAVVRPAPCTDANRQAPDTWYECILALEQDGFAELAGAERDRLLTTFPDFEIPDSTDE